MGADAKLDYFRCLVRLGYKEIEVSYPSASQTEFDFTRHLAAAPGLVPDDVWIQVMAPCRPELIRRTVESVRGAGRVIVHLHLSTSEYFRRVVFSKTEDEMVDLAVRCTRLLRELTKDSSDPELTQTEWTYEFTPENFQHTTLDFAVRICEAVKAAWEPTARNQIILNLPSTIEAAMPNVFADQIEAFCARITERDKVCVSLHTHNDRGCAAAAAEMAQLAGGDRVEGCLFGNGERTGNVDLVTLALNLYTQGVDPGVDFGDINRVVAIVERLTKVPVHLRAPYAGRYVFCTFTGAHQDAIRKGYKRRRLDSEAAGQVQKWEMPYLPMDPEDLGRENEAVIRVNSQSGKSGIAWLVKEVFGFDMPLALELDFTRAVQDRTTATGAEVTPGVIKSDFESKYMLVGAAEPELVRCSHDYGGLRPANPTATRGHGVTNGTAEKRKIANGALDENSAGSKLNGVSTASLQATVVVQRVQHDVRGRGREPATGVGDAIRDLGFRFEFLHHQTQPVGRANASFVQLRSEKMSTAWGVGLHEDPVWACMQAVSASSYG